MTFPGIPISNPPKAYLDIIIPLVEKAKSFLENGESLTPMAFVGNLETGQTIPIMLESASPSDKDRSALAIRMAAQSINANFVFVIMEAYSLIPSKVARYEKVLDDYGSIANCPASWRMDVVSMTLETQHGGIWSAQIPIKPKGISKKKRTIGKLEFQHFSEVAGRFVDLLSRGEEGSSTLH